MANKATVRRRFNNVKFYTLSTTTIICFAYLFFTYFRPNLPAINILSSNHGYYFWDPKTEFSSIPSQGSLFRSKSSDIPLANMKEKLFTFSDARVCSGLNSEDNDERFDAVILIPSRSDMAKRRQIIRDTWANKSTYHRSMSFRYQTLFVVSHHSNNVPDLLNDEVKRKRDIIVANIEQHYKLLTVQLLIGMTWIHKHCSNLKYVLKIDDDSYVHLGELDRLIQRTEGEKSHREQPIYGGHCQPNTKVSREANLGMPKDFLKWIVPKSKYPDATFPTYCNGPAYFFSASLLHKIVSMCPFHCIGFANSKLQTNNSNCFWEFEDVFFGSCINTFAEKPYINLLTKKTQYLFSINSIPDMHMMKTRPPMVIIHPVKDDEKLIELHQMNQNY